MEYVKIGQIVNTFGIKGELKIKSCSDFDDERYQKGNTIYLRYNGKYLPFIVKGYRVHKGMNLVLLQDHEDINLIEQYKNCDVFFDKQEAQKSLKDDEFYYDELIGMQVVNQDQEKIGEVIDIEEGVNNNLLRIKKLDDKESLVPYNNAFVINVDQENNTLMIKVIEGLL